MASPLARELPTLLTTSVPLMAAEARLMTWLLLMPVVLFTTTAFVLPDWRVRLPVMVNVEVSLPPRPGARVPPLPRTTAPPATVPAPIRACPEPRVNEGGAETSSVPPLLTWTRELAPSEELAPTIIACPPLIIVEPV